MVHRVVIAVLLIAVSARAEDRFGRRGQVVPFGSVSFQHSGGSGFDSNAIAILPGALWFAADNFAIGGSVGYRRAWGGPFASIDALSISPEAGIAIPLGDRAAFFPRFGLESLTVWNGGNSSFFAIRAFAPVLFFVAPHFYIGFGPDFLVTAAGPGGSPGTWNAGAMSEIGGYF